MDFLKKKLDDKSIFWTEIDVSREGEQDFKLYTL
ncbi:uncharacterized protein METZ01_LOCUS238054 [marine metagenome]|uniref:Uncharacterized protein n=1 Tax=marine metagenome TaxID=408172 RepID=A0A382HD49_9ZZZZ